MVCYVEGGGLALTAECVRPAAWPRPPQGVTTYGLVGRGRQYTGYPVERMTRTRIAVRDFPLQPASRFALPSVPFLEE